MRELERSAESLGLRKTSFDKGNDSARALRDALVHESKHRG